MNQKDAEGDGGVGMLSLTPRSTRAPVGAHPPGRSVHLLAIQGEPTENIKAKEGKEGGQEVAFTRRSTIRTRAAGRERLRLPFLHRGRHARPEEIQWEGWLLAAAAADQSKRPRRRWS